MIQIEISSNDQNKRLDKFVKKYLSKAPDSFIYKLFRKKDVKVNKKPKPIDYITQVGDVITIYITKEQEETIKADYQKKYLSSHKDATPEDVKIMYYVGTYNGCVIAMYTHTWHSNFDFPFSEEITDGYGIGYNIDNYLNKFLDNTGDLSFKFITLKQISNTDVDAFSMLTYMPELIDLKFRGTPSTYSHVPPQYTSQLFSAKSLSHPTGFSSTSQ